MEPHTNDDMPVNSGHQKTETIEQPPVAPFEDHASKSLAEALRTSFALLSVIMLLLLLAYMFSGFFTVESFQRAVVLRFGKIVGSSELVDGKVLKSGLHFRWPFPIDQQITVSTRQKTLDLDSLWHFEQPGDAGRPESEKVDKIASNGLRPRFDGALLTGDHGLMHLKWSCTYQIPDDDDQAVLDYINNVSDEKALLASALENASIETAGTYPVETIWRGNEQFRYDVTLRTQKILDQLKTGLRIAELKLVIATPPLQTLRAFQEVTRADQLREQQIQDAMKTATETLQNAAGENCLLIHETILAYEKALEANDASTTEYQQRIMEMFDQEKTQGTARRLIQDAQANASALINEAKQNHELYTKLKQAYYDNPELTVSRLWMQCRQDIFTGQTNIRLMFPQSDRYVIFPKIDGEILRRIKNIQVKEDMNSAFGY